MLRECTDRAYAAAVALIIVAGCTTEPPQVQPGTPSIAVSNAQTSTAYAALANVQQPALPGRSARTVLHEEVNEAENLFFTEDGRLFVSGGEDIYEMKRAADGTFTKTDGFNENYLVEGIVRGGQYLYGVCWDPNDPESPAFLIAGELTEKPVFRTIAPLASAAVPNGMTMDSEGRLYITYTLTHQIVRVTFASPLEIDHIDVWADGVLFVNGIKYVDHAMYVTMLDLTLVGRLLRIPMLQDGRAGEPEELYERPLTVLDDILPFEGGIIVTDFLKGTLIFWDEQRGAYAETPEQTFYGPTSLALGEPPMFDERQLIVAEKGAFLVRDEVEGDLLSAYQLP